MGQILPGSRLRPKQFKLQNLDLGRVIHPLLPVFTRPIPIPNIPKSPAFSPLSSTSLPLQIRHRHLHLRRFRRLHSRFRARLSRRPPHGRSTLLAFWPYMHG
ncbi:hypothetical protein Salat_2804800 [Sesamum alatum]|uniref:Uncharacterized protein n=1 Tax=Sesamum alatum TaxID=300844 RepID=A0AAE1XL13_9LAMI|nr:hypothetical protein Salat_2804800 [Sesamum alatum]